MNPHTWTIELHGVSPRVLVDIRRMAARRYTAPQIARYVGIHVDDVNFVLGRGERTRNKRREAIRESKGQMLRNMPADYTGTPEQWRALVEANFGRAAT